MLRTAAPPRRLRVIYNNVLLSKRRNDIAFLINETLIVIADHQSTPNPNMPLRLLQYVLLYYELFTNLSNALYSKKLIPLPKPEFYVLYNGEETYAPSGILKLSDAFLGLDKDELPQLELIVNVVNIKYDEMSESLNKNEYIRGYAFFVKKVSEQISNGKKLKAAIRQATQECLKDGILTDFLKKFKKEVEAMFSLVYDEKRAIEVAHEEGLEKGLDISTEIIRELLKQTPVEEIAARYNTPVQKVIKLRTALFQVSA